MCRVSITMDTSLSTSSVVKRKRSQSSSVSKKKKKCATGVSTTTVKNPTPETFEFDTMDYESLVACLTDDAVAVDLAACENAAITAAKTATTTPATDSMGTLHCYTANPSEGLLSYRSTPASSLLPPPPAPLQQQQLQPQYVPEPASHDWEPRLLLRQSYKVSNQADAVIGLESRHDYRASAYLVTTQACVKLNFEDLLSVQSISVSSVMDNYFNSEGAKGFSPFYFDSIIIEPSSNGPSYGKTTVATIDIYNYQLSSTQRTLYQTAMTGMTRQSPSIVLNYNGWTALKRLFHCIESYYRLCVDCSPVVQSLIERYCDYFGKHYNTVAQQARANNVAGNNRLPLATYHHIKTDLFVLLRELNESRLPAAHWSTEINDDSPAHNTHSSNATATTTRLTTAFDRVKCLLPWIDSEVKKFCSTNICGQVLQRLKYDYDVIG